MENLTKKWNRWLADYYNGELLFFTGFIIYLSRNMWATTTFPLPGMISKLCLLLSLLFVSAKILLFDGYKVESLLILIFSMIGVFLIIVSSTYLNVLLWTMMLIGARNISFRKILKTYLIITAAIMFLAFCSSLLGVIENFQYQTSKRGIRNSFGITYTTDFAAHVFYILLVYAYLKGPHLRLYHYIIIFVTACLIYHFCNTRLDCCSIVLIVILFGLGNWIEHSRSIGRNCKKLWEKGWKNIGLFIMPALAIISFLATIFFNPSNTFLKRINSIISGRLALGQASINKNGYSLFGQPIDMIGMGGGTEFPSNYNFVDCSYIFVLLRYGIIFALAIVIIYTLACHKYSHNLYFLYAIALVAINCTIAHHLLEIEYNPFSLALLATSIIPCTGHSSS